MEHRPAKRTIRFMEKTEQQVNNLEITMAQLKNDIGYIKDSLKNNDSQHKEIIQKIDHLGDTFQGKIQDKADQKEVMDKFDSYVQLETFRPVQKIVYGLVGAILLAFLCAVVALILK